MLLAEMKKELNIDSLSILPDYSKKIFSPYEEHLKKLKIREIFDNYHFAISLIYLIQVLRKITICSSYLPTVFPIHPRTKKKLIEFDLWDELSQMKGVKILDPLGYHPFLKLQMHAKAILTDSGGVQEESSFLNIPCLTLTVNTERPITLEKGTNLLVGGKSNSFFKEQIEKILSGEWKQARLPSNWDGNTAERIVAVLLEKANL